MDQNPGLKVGDFAGEQAVMALPSGTILHHGTSGDWDPAAVHLRGPAWFGDADMAESYNVVMGHDSPVVLAYETVRPLRLLDVSAGTPASAEIEAMWEEETVPSDMAHACAQAGYDGWFEHDGEVMVCDTRDVRLMPAAHP
jgi:hypothetical protein